jgi:hypothetical protein
MSVSAQNCLKISCSEINKFLYIFSLTKRGNLTNSAVLINDSFFVIFKVIQHTASKNKNSLEQFLHQTKRYQYAMCTRDITFIVLYGKSCPRQVKFSQTENARKLY